MKYAEEMMANRIRKWKSIAPKEKTQSQHFQVMTKEKYHRLFDTVQKKHRGKFNKKRENTFAKSQQFVDKDKLYREMNIF